jgi:hypothetical protein
MVSGSYTQSTEFTRLFNFFESLVSRGKATDDARDDVDTDPNSSESSGFVADGSTDDEHSDDDLASAPAPCEFPTHNSMPPASESTQRTAFARSVNHKFTFKLMIHKLYGLEEWITRVQNTLVNSRVQFKSLSEMPESPSTAATTEIVSEVKKTPRQRSRSVVVTRTRSGSLHNIKHSPTSLAVSTLHTRSRSVCDLGVSATRRSSVETHSRVLKRRCMQWEKSMSNARGAESSSIEWAYSETQLLSDSRVTETSPQGLEVVDPQENRDYPRTNFNPVSELDLGSGKEAVFKNNQLSPVGSETVVDRRHTGVSRVRETLKRRVVS